MERTKPHVVISQRRRRRRHQGYAEACAHQRQHRVDLAELLDNARRRDGSAPPGPLRPVVDLESGSGLQSVYRLRLELPQIDSGALNLGRVGDDLIVGAGGMRRRVRLASVLRRCTVLDAHLRGSELTVRFRPDPEVWPR